MSNRLLASQLLVLSCLSSNAHAKPSNIDQITLIRETAANICNTVSGAKGQKSEAQIAGDVKAQLGGLAGKLADVGLEGKTAARREAFEGLSQEATADALHGDRSCRERLFNKMFDVVNKEIERDAPPTENKSIIDKKAGTNFDVPTEPFIGEWIGTVICQNDKNFLITLNIKKQNGDTASGIAQWEGHLRGSTSFRLVPDPSRKELSSYIYIPSDSSVYAYRFTRSHKDKLIGQSIGSEKCGIILER